MIPTEEELIKFIKSKDLVNFSLIAKHFKIKNTTVSDLISSLEHKKLVEVAQLGGSKIVRLKENKNKKAQVTIYAILGILVVIALVTIFSLRNYIIKSEFEREAEKIQVIDEFKPVKEYLDSCIKEITLQGTRILGSQAGYINLPEDDLPININVPFSNKLNVFGNDALQVPYWFYETANGIQKTQIPKIEEIQNQLANYLNLNLNTCLTNFTAFEGYDFSNINDINTEVEIRDEKIFVKVLSDFEVSKDELTTKFNKFLISIDIPLGKLYKTALDVFDKSNKNNFFEEKTIDMMVLYDEIPFSKTEFSCDIKIWNENQVKKDFKRIVNRNIGATKANNLDAKDYFTLSSIDQDIDANFLYSENWPFYIDVFPSENGILKGDEIIKKTGALRILSSFLCLNNYHFVYDVKYPVLITLTKDNYNFQFAQMVIIDNNQPKKNVLGILDPIEGVNICDRKLTKTKVNTFTITNDNEVVTLDEVDVSFKCFTTTCNIGKTNKALLEEEFPQCLNGQVIAEKQGYNKAISFVSTNQEAQISLILEPLYNKQLEIKVIDKNSGKIRSLNENEQVLLNIKGTDNDYSTTINYPEANDLDLIAGNYEITTTLITKSSTGIKINPETIQKCIKVPKGGLLGLFFDETKCLDTTLEGFTLDEVVTGGAGFEYEIPREILVNSNKITIYTVFDKIPINNEEIFNVYDNINLNSQNPNFKYPELK